MTEKIIMDRQLFKKPFKQTDNVILPCPTCKGLSLKLDNRKFMLLIQHSQEKFKKVKKIGISIGYHQFLQQYLFVAMVLVVSM